MGIMAILVMWPGPFEQTFIPPSQSGSTWHLASVGLLVIEKKKFKNIESSSDLDQGQWITLTFGTLKALCTHLVELAASTNIYIIDYNSFWKINCFNFFSYKSIGDQIWPYSKIGQGQPRIIIWTNLVVLEYPMLHTNFQGHRSLVPEKNIF